LGNAIRDATGVRLTATPFAPDRIFRQVMAAQESWVSANRTSVTGTSAIAGMW
jgi:hypothetical protein